MIITIREPSPAAPPKMKKRLGLRVGFVLLIASSISTISYLLFQPTQVYMTRSLVASMRTTMEMTAAGTTLIQVISEEPEGTTTTTRLLREVVNQPMVESTTTTTSHRDVVVVLQDEQPTAQQQVKNRTDQLNALRTYQALAGDSRYSSLANTNNNNNKDDDILPFGHVMRELGQRLLLTSSGSSNKDDDHPKKVVVIMSPRSSSVGTNLFQLATNQGHATHYIRTNNDKVQYLDDWWRNQQPSSRLWLTVLDQPSSKIFSSSNDGDSFLDSSSSAGPTMRYIVTSVTATMTTATAGETTKYTFEGTHTARHLMSHHYKVQLLSASDYWNSVELMGQEDATTTPSEDAVLFAPNTLLTQDNLHTFLKWGAKAASTSRSLVVATTNQTKTTTTTTATFKAYLFCTRGLDLAIPSRRQYVINGTYAPKPRWAMPYANATGERKKMIQEHVNFTACDSRELLKVEFRKQEETTKNEPWDAVSISCMGVDVTQVARHHANNDDDSTTSVQLWMNKGVIPQKAEAVCVKLNCHGMYYAATGKRYSINSIASRQQVACATRIVPSKRHIMDTSSSLSLPSKASDNNKKKKRLGGGGGKSKAAAKPNILVVMMDSLSRSQFEFIMPRTHTLLTTESMPKTERTYSKFVHFSNYTTVGDHSEPNRRALYAGSKKQLDDDSNSGDEKKSRWIWDHLNELGYATFKADDGCRADSGDSPSANNTTHGASLDEMFCFHFARPNCVGPKLAAKHLLDHTKEFIETYNDKNPWAAFVSLVDTREDTQTLGAIVDEPVMKFFNWTMHSENRPRNTVLLFVSDQGLDYGPYFQSNAGERERSQPLLYMRVPRKLGGHERMQVNSDAWVTPLDVHATLFNFVGLEGSEGTSMYKNLASSRSRCKDATAIPQHHCEVLEQNPQALISSSSHEAPSPPSLMSFYADIPKDQRLKNYKCKISSRDVATTFQVAREKRDELKTNGEDIKPCNCSTSHRNWFPCESNPWGKDGLGVPQETFLMVSCPNLALQYQTRVLRNTKAIDQLPSRQRSKDESSPPNILILEVDSVSVQYADRHFPKTRELLRRYRSTANNKKCHNGLCSVDFSRFGVVGPNSITNQVASLSGCFTTNRHESCFDHESIVGDICLDSSLYEFGLELRSKGPRDHMVYCPPQEKKPFLYDIAKDEGYVTFFGEEFCYPGSPWVLQDNVFPVKADVELHNVFCRLAKRAHPEEADDKLYNYAVRSKCMEGTTAGKRLQEIGLEMLDQMWAAYDNVPKFAYLNALAAHVYTPNSPTQGLNAEEYDESLSTFLQSLFNRPDAHKTIVVVRSDHGLQGGSTHTIDYSTQIEQQHPWTEIVIPDSYPVDMLVKNSDKVTTPFDLYATVRSLMVGKKDHAPGIKTPEWFTNLLHETIDPNKSCKERKLLPEYCPSSETPAPTFGVCNMFEREQAVFCRDPANGGKLELRTTAGTKSSGVIQKTSSTITSTS